MGRKKLRVILKVKGQVTPKEGADKLITTRGEARVADPIPNGKRRGPGRPPKNFTCRSKPGPKSRKRQHHEDAVNEEAPRTATTLAQRLLHSQAVILLQRASVSPSEIPPSTSSPPPRKKSKVETGTCWICMEKCDPTTPSTSDLDPKAIGTFKHLIFTPLFLESFLSSAPPSVGQWPCAKCSLILHKVSSWMDTIAKLENQVRQEVLKVRAIMKGNWGLTPRTEVLSVPSFQKSFALDKNAPTPPLVEEEEEQEEIAENNKEKAAEAYPDYFLHPTGEDFDDYMDDPEEVKPFIFDPLDVEIPPEVEAEELLEPPFPQETVPVPVPQKKRKTTEVDAITVVHETPAEIIESLPLKRRSRIKAEQLVHKLALEAEEDGDDGENEKKFQAQEDASADLAEPDPPYMNQEEEEEEEEESEVDDHNDQDFQMNKTNKSPKKARPKSTGDPSTGKKKKKSWNDNTPCECPTCGKKMSSKRALFAHNEGVHQGIRRHTCIVCAKQFYRMTNLKVHLRFHRKEGTLHDGVEDVPTSKGVFSCTKCDRTYSYERSLTAHMAEFHENIRKHQCPHCPKAYYKRREYANHLINHAAPNEVGSFPCLLTTCDKVFRTVDSMKSHMRNTHQNQRTFTCDRCARTFNKRNNLTRHLESHKPPAERTVCTTCGKIFPNIQMREEHQIRVHKGGATFSCSYCGKSFPRAQTLKSHLKTHTAEKPFQCEKCGRKFGHKSSIHKHKLTVCGEDEKVKERVRSMIRQSQIKHRMKKRTIHCDLCDRKFATVIRLADHKKRLHPGEETTTPADTPPSSPEEPISVHPAEDRTTPTLSVIPEVFVSPTLALIDPSQAKMS